MHARSQDRFDGRDAELAPNGQEVSSDGPAPDRLRPILRESALSRIGIAAQDGGAERPGSFATVLIGCGGLLQEGLSRILDEAGFQVIASATSVDQLPLIDLRQHQGILLIVDARHDAETAIMQVQSFKQLHPDSRVVVLTETDRIADLASLVQAGANAFFSIGTTSEVLLKTVELTMLGETFLPPTLLAEIWHLQEAPVPEPTGGGSARLSTQEDRVLRNLAEGHSNKMIARKLGIAEATVKVHVRNILREIGANNRTQAAMWAMDNASLGRKAVGSQSEARPEVRSGAQIS